jgi:hypothetical protein
MRIARPAPSAAICLLLWLVWALNERGWVSINTEVRLWVGQGISGLLLLFLLFIVWLILLVRNLWAWRRPPRARVHANLLCLGLAALVAFELPSKAVTMFYLWHDDFQSLTHTPGALFENHFRNHWKYGTVSTGDPPGGGVAVHFDYGYNVPGLLYNSHDQPELSETTVICDPEYRDGGFIRRLEPNWFLCYNMVY